MQAIIRIKSRNFVFILGKIVICSNDMAVSRFKSQEMLDNDPSFNDKTLFLRFRVSGLICSGTGTVPNQGHASIYTV